MKVEEEKKKKKSNPVCLAHGPVCTSVQTRRMSAGILLA